VRRRVYANTRLLTIRETGEAARAERPVAGTNARQLHRILTAEVEYAVECD